MRAWKFAVALIVCAGAFCCWPVRECPAEVAESLESVCTVFNEDNSGGTGFVYAVDKESLWVITAGHVVVGKSNTTVYFYVDGRRSPQIKAEVVACENSDVPRILMLFVPPSEIKPIDLAVLKVCVKDCAFSPLPRPLKFGSNPKTDDPIYSSGCPDLNWPSMFRGCVHQAWDHMFAFGPEIIHGRSGSPILNEAGEVVGLAIWQGNDRSMGVSVSCMRSTLSWEGYPKYTDAE